MSCNWEVLSWIELPPNFFRRTWTNKIIKLCCFSKLSKPISFKSALSAPPLLRHGWEIDRNYSVHRNEIMISQILLKVRFKIGVLSDKKTQTEALAGSGLGYETSLNLPRRSSSFDRAFCYECQEKVQTTLLMKAWFTIVAYFKKVPRPGGEPGIFWFFVYFLSLKQRLRPLGYCAPHNCGILW